MDMMAVAAHVRRRILEEPIKLDPFPHMEVSGLVPDEYYGLILRNLPAPELCLEVDEGRNFEFTPTHLPPELRSAASEFWRRFDDHVSRTVVATAVDRFSNRIDAYLDHMRERWLVRRNFTSRHMREGATSWTATQVFRRTKGYSSDPHFHRIDETVSCLFYFPPDDSHVHLGTDLYRVVEPFWASWHDLAKYSYVDRRCIELAHTTKFVPNNALIYFNTPWSIHGNRMQEQDYDRWFALVTLNAPTVVGPIPAFAERLSTRYNPFKLNVFAPFS
jgi:hypothetical protein